MGVVQAINQATNAMKTKELLIFHAMGTTINLNTKLVKGTTTRLTNHANEDINEKVMISS